MLVILFGILALSFIMIVVVIYRSLRRGEQIPPLGRLLVNGLARAGAFLGVTLTRAANGLSNLRPPPVQPGRPMPTSPAGTAGRAAPGAPTFELRGKVAQLQRQGQTIARRNRYLAGALGGGVIVLLLVLWGLYQAGVGSYAVLDNVTIEREPTNQGLVKISFRVVSPGKVYYKRTSGSIETELVHQFNTPTDGARDFKWSWVYEPGQDINVLLRYRGSLWRTSRTEAFPTTKAADIVILIDTTESMGRYINMLQTKCVDFSTRLKAQKINHRFAVIGFGDTQEGEWLYQQPFTENVDRFKKDVDGLKRFPGGDLPESALDALEEALKLPFQSNSIRRCYLVTDATYHDPAQSGARSADIAEQLKQKQILLHVFSRPEFEEDYRKLLGNAGKFQEIENFGEVLTQGRILED